MDDVDSTMGTQHLAEGTGHAADGAQAAPGVAAQSGRGVVGKKANVAAVIVAGGSGERFGRPGGKQLLPICGKPLMSWCLQAFDAVPMVGKIVIVCPEARIEEYRSLAVEPYCLATPVEFACAGSIRQESALNGVELASQEFPIIAMHDGARPLILPETIVHAINVLKGTLDADGVVCGHPAIDTLKVVEGSSVVGTPDRSMFWIAQTPQIFHSDILLEAHRTALQEGYVGTDDASLVERIGGKVVLVDCPRDNMKLTVPEDLPAVSSLLHARFGEVQA